VSEEKNKKRTRCSGKEGKICCGGQGEMVKRKERLWEEVGIGRV
jgi:hypothetical protein